MKRVILNAIAFLLLLSATASSQEFKVLGVSESEMYCQVLNQDFDCQLIENKLSVTIRSLIEDLEADLDIKCGRELLGTYPDKCNRTENLYTCYFDLEPIIKIEKQKDCEMIFYFYKKFSNESIGSDKYEGNLRVTPLLEHMILSLEKQESKLQDDFLTVKYFDQESVYNSGICSYLGTGILFGKINEYEKDFEELGGKVIQGDATSVKSLNLLKTSSVLASEYAEGGDMFLSLLLDHFLYQGLLTGNFISDIIYQLKEGYLSGNIFESMDNDVGESCEKIQDHFDHLLNPNFLVINKVKIIDCLEKKDYKNCWKKLEGIRNYVNPGHSPLRSELRFYFNNYLLRDRSNVCEGGEIRVTYENLERFGVDHIRVTGHGCDNPIQVSGEGSKTFTVSEFLCGDAEPVDGGSYSIGIDPGVFGEEVFYKMYYYEDSENCKVQQVVIPV